MCNKQLGSLEFRGGSFFIIFFYISTRLTENIGMNGKKEVMNVEKYQIFTIFMHHKK
jgi:hypothetical protein